MLKAICVGSRVIAWECDLIDLKNIITSIASCNVEEIPFSAEFEPISPKVGECVVCYLKSADQCKGIEINVIVEGHNSTHFTIKVIWSDEKLPCFLWVKYFCEKESVFHEVSMSPGKLTWSSWYIEESHRHIVTAVACEFTNDGVEEVSRIDWKWVSPSVVDICGFICEHVSFESHVFVVISFIWAASSTGTISAHIGSVIHIFVIDSRSRGDPASYFIIGTVPFQRVEDKLFTINKEDAGKRVSWH